MLYVWPVDNLPYRDGHESDPVVSGGQLATHDPTNRVMWGEASLQLSHFSPNILVF